MTRSKNFDERIVRRNIIKLKLFRGFLSFDLLRKFHELELKGKVEELSEYLKALKEILKDPLPDGEEMEDYVPTSLEVKRKYKEMMAGLDEMPEDEESRKIYVKMAAGQEYKAFRRAAEKILERLKRVKGLIRDLENANPDLPRPARRPVRFGGKK